jgi:DNA topoisomerase-1
MARLKIVTRDDLTIVRRRSGKGFTFVDSSGKRVPADAFSRAQHLGIPPAWSEVHVADHPRAHIQCCGTDEAGRVQYIYHPDWEMKRSERKRRRLDRLSQALPKIRRRVAKDLGAEAGSQTLALALAVGLIDKTAMRVGRERYLTERGTRGAGTLYSRDVLVDGPLVAISFPAKSGKVAEYAFADPKLADAIARIKALPGKRLLSYRDGEGKVRPIKTEAINTYLRSIAEAEISAKDFRTLHASALAAEALAQLEPAESEAGRKRQIAGVARQVADFLQNTPLISKKSYIVPELFALFDAGRLSALWQKGSTAAKGLRLREVRLREALGAAA